MDIWDIIERAFGVMVYLFIPWLQAFVVQMISTHIVGTKRSTRMIMICSLVYSLLAFTTLVTRTLYGFYYMVVFAPFSPVAAILLIIMVFLEWILKIAKKQSSY